MPLVGNNIFSDLKDIFNLPDNAKAVEIRIAVNEIVTVRAEFYPDTDEECANYFKRYTLTEAKPETLMIPQPQPESRSQKNPPKAKLVTNHKPQWWLW